MLSSNLDFQEQQALLMAFREQASPRRMRVGTEITLRYLTDGPLRGVDVALSRDETVRLTRTGGAWSSNLVETPVYTDTVMVAGEVVTSLWESVISNDALDGPPLRGPCRTGGSARSGLPVAAGLLPPGAARGLLPRGLPAPGPAGRLHARRPHPGRGVRDVGKPFHAVWFDPNGDDKGSYFDLQGKSVRRSFLLKPLEFRGSRPDTAAGAFTLC